MTTTRLRPRHIWVGSPCRQCGSPLAIRVGVPFTPIFNPLPSPLPLYGLESWKPPFPDPFAIHWGMRGKKEKKKKAGAGSSQKTQSMDIPSFARPVPTRLLRVSASCHWLHLWHAVMATSDLGSNQKTARSTGESLVDQTVLYMGQPLVGRPLKPDMSHSTGKVDNGHLGGHAKPAGAAEKGS